MGDYYKDQLNKLGNPRAGYTPSIKITGSASYTDDMSLNDESATALVNWLSDHYTIGQPVVTPAKRKTVINKSYTHLCVSKATGKIVDAWSYDEDMPREDVLEFYKMDMRDNDRLIKDYKLELAVVLFKKGIDPYDSLNWGNN